MTRRRPHLVALWWLLVLGIAALFGSYITTGDGWRTFGAALVLVCVLAVRRDLTEEPTA